MPAMNARRVAAWSRFGAATLFVLSAALGTRAQPPAAVPPDRAVLELDLPDGAAATLDGAAIGSKRRFEFADLRPGAWSEHKLAWANGAGPRAERAVLLKGGWHVRLRPVEPAGQPELVLQSGLQEVERWSVDRCRGTRASRLPAPSRRACPLATGRSCPCSPRARRARRA